MELEELDVVVLEELDVEVVDTVEVDDELELVVVVARHSSSLTKNENSCPFCKCSTDCCAVETLLATSEHVETVLDRYVKAVHFGAVCLQYSAHVATDKLFLTSYTNLPRALKPTRPIA